MGHRGPLLPFLTTLLLAAALHPPAAAEAPLAVSEPAEGATVGGTVRVEGEIPPDAEAWVGWGEAPCRNRTGDAACVPVQHARCEDGVCRFVAFLDSRGQPNGAAVVRLEAANGTFTRPVTVDNARTHRGFGAFLGVEPVTVAMNPGMKNVSRWDLWNWGNREESVRVRVEGPVPDGALVTVEPLQATLSPGERRTLQVAFHTAKDTAAATASMHVVVEAADGETHRAPFTFQVPVPKSGEGEKESPGAGALVTGAALAAAAVAAGRRGRDR